MPKVMKARIRMKTKGNLVRTASWKERFCSAKRTNLRLLIFGRTAAAAAGAVGLEIQAAPRRHGELREPPRWSGAELENEGGRRQPLPGGWCCCCLTAARGRGWWVLAFIAAEVYATCPWWTASETGRTDGQTSIRILIVLV